MSKRIHLEVLSAAVLIYGFTIAAPVLTSTALSNPMHRAAGTLAGKWKSEDLTVVIEAAGDGYKGTLTLGDKSYEFKASANGAVGLKGTFSSGDDKFEFSGSADGDTLAIKTGDHVLLSVDPLPSPVQRQV